MWKLTKVCAIKIQRSTLILHLFYLIDVSFILPLSLQNRTKLSLLTAFVFSFYFTSFDAFFPFLLAHMSKCLHGSVFTHDYLKSLSQIFITSNIFFVLMIQIAFPLPQVSESPVLRLRYPVAKTEFSKH